MKDILLDGNGDIVLDASGDICFTDSVKQAIEIRLRWFENEWKLGPDIGIPYFSEGFVKSPNKTILEERMREAISSVDEVDEIESFELTIDNARRKMTVAFVVKCAGDAITEGAVTINV